MLKDTAPVDEEPDEDQYQTLERLDHAKAAKEEGNTYFKAKEYTKAIAAYQQGSALVEGKKRAAAEGVDPSRDLLVTCQLNMAQCALKREDWSLAVESTTRALKLSPQNGKALYRRGVARMGQTRFEDAKKDLHAVAKTDPTNAEIRNKLAECTKQLSAAHAKERAIEKEMSVDPATEFAKMMEEAA